MKECNDKWDKAKRIGAMAGVILLAGMVLATLILAFVRFPGSKEVFQGMIMLDIAVPLILWGYICILNWAKGRDDNLKKKADEIIEKMDAEKTE